MHITALMRPDKEGRSFTQTAQELSDIVDKNLWQADGQQNPWNGCFYALALLLNPQGRVFDALEALPPAPDMLDETGILSAMANMGHYAREVQAMPVQLDPRLFPCLFVPANNDAAPFIVISRSDNGIVIFDAEKRGTRKLKSGHPLCRLQGKAWIFQPYDHNRQGVSKFMRGGTGHSWFRALLDRFSTTFLHIFLAGLALNIVALASPLYMMAVYDMIISPSDLASLTAITGGAVIALVAEYALRGSRSKALSWLSARLDNIVGNKIFTHLLGLPPELVEKASVAAQIARIKTFESIRDLFSGSIFLSFLEIPYVIIALTIIGMIAGPLVWVPMGMILGYVALFALLRHKIKVIIRLAAKASSARQQFTLETFEKLTGIHANGLSKIWSQKYDDLSSREIVMNFQLAWLGTIAETCAQALTMLAAVLTVGYGVHLVWINEISAGALIATMMLAWRVVTPFYSLCAMIPRLEQLRNSVIQVNDLMDLDTEEESAMAAARLPDIRGDIALSNVIMRYSPEQEAVLNEMNFAIEAGKFVCLTGRNGSGKTSFLKLVKGIYRPQGGSLRIDGFDTRQLDPLYLRRHIAYVPQHPDFFTGTLIENLRFARPLASENDVIHALTLADAWNEVKALPEGLRTPIAPGNLPNGFAAKLSLARAYLHGGTIMLIDELPSSLLSDRAGEYLRRYIERSKGKRTIIMVTQREEFIDTADRVLELRKGAMPRLKSQREQQAVTPNLRESA